MPDDAVQKLAEALTTILKGDSPPPETPAAATPPPAQAAPAAPAVPAEIAALAAQQTGPQPPPGKAPLRTLDEWEALPQDERIERMDEADALYLRENGGS